MWFHWRSNLFKACLKTLSVGFCLLYGVMATASETLILEVVTVYEKDTLWRSPDVDNMFAKTNKILEQCSIYIVKAKEIHTEHTQISMGYESAPISNIYYNSENKPVVLLINGVDYKQSAGLSPGPSAVYLSVYSQSAEYRNAHSPEYDVFAHELGHMLGGLKHLVADQEKNLMAAYVARQSDYLSPEQCDSMRTHKHLKPYSDEQLSRRR